MFCAPKLPNISPSYTVDPIKDVTKTRGLSNYVLSLGGKDFATPLQAVGLSDLKS